MCIRDSHHAVDDRAQVLVGAQLRPQRGVHDARANRFRVVQRVTCLLYTSGATGGAAGGKLYGFPQLVQALPGSGGNGNDRGRRIWRAGQARAHLVLHEQRPFLVHQVAFRQRHHCLLYTSTIRAAVAAVVPARKKDKLAGNLCALELGIQA